MALASSFSRRVLLAMPACASTLTGSSPGPKSQFRLDRVSNRCWAAIALPWATVPQCNSAVFVGDEYVAVVDAQATVDCARSLRLQIRNEITEKPVRYVILTHHHMDHAHGAAAYGDTIIASSQPTKELLRQQQPWFRDYSAYRNPVVRANDQLSGYYEFLDSALLRGGRELAVHGNASWAKYFEERRTVPIPLPSITFSGEFRIELGELELRVSTVGSAHTAGDAIVYAPSEGAVATGDLLNSFEPLLFEAEIINWSKELHQLASRDFRTVIPGHGQLQTGKNRLLMFTAYFDELHIRVSDGIEKGTTREQLQQELTPITIRALANGYGAELRREYSFYNSAPLLLENAVRENVREMVRRLTIRN